MSSIVRGKKQFIFSDRSISKEDIIVFFSFLFFLTISADLLSFNFHLFTVKANHIISLFFITFYILFKRIIFVDRPLFFSFLLVFFSAIVSTFFSPHIYRSIIYDLFFLFNMAVYFYLPMNIIIFFCEKKILNAYFLSFLCTGVYAIIQFILPFFWGSRSFCGTKGC